MHTQNSSFKSSQCDSQNSSIKVHKVTWVISCVSSHLLCQQSYLSHLCQQRTAVLYGPPVQKKKQIWNKRLPKIVGPCMHMQNSLFKCSQWDSQNSSIRVHKVTCFFFPKAFGHNKSSSVGQMHVGRVYLFRATKIGRCLSRKRYIKEKCKWNGSTSTYTHVDNGREQELEENRKIDHESSLVHVQQQSVLLIVQAFRYCEQGDGDVQHVSMVMSDEMRIQGHRSTLEVNSVFCKPLSRKPLSHCATHLTYVLLTTDDRWVGIQLLAIDTSWIM